MIKCMDGALVAVSTSSRSTDFSQVGGNIDDRPQSIFPNAQRRLRRNTELASLNFKCIRPGLTAQV